MYSLTNFHGCGHQYPREISSRVFVTPKWPASGSSWHSHNTRCDKGHTGRIRDDLGIANHLVWWSGQGSSFWSPWRGFEDDLESHWRMYRSWMHGWSVGVRDHHATYKWKKMQLVGFQQTSRLLSIISIPEADCKFVSTRNGINFPMLATWSKYDLKIVVSEKCWLTSLPSIQSTSDRGKIN